MTLYSFQLEGDRAWYRCGTEKPAFNEGDSINFEYESDGKNLSVKPNTVTKLAATAAVRAPAVAAKSAVKENWDARAAYWDAKEKREIAVVEPRITLSAGLQRSRWTMYWDKSLKPIGRKSPVPLACWRTNRRR